MKKLLSINQKYEVVGGSDTYYFSLNKLLEKEPLEVVEFAAYGKLASKSKFKNYFPSQIEFSKNNIFNLCKYLYNLEAKEMLAKLLMEQPDIDIAHLQIYYGQLTTSILHSLKKKNIPIIQTLHEYKLSCPVYTHLNNGEICHRCIDGSSISCVSNRCKDGSFISSLVRFLEYNISRALGDVSLIDKFICVSVFQRDLLASAGLPFEKMTVVYNFVEAEFEDSEIVNGEYLFYFGRLEKLKGIVTLLYAAKSMSHIRFKIAGDGPLKEYILSFIKEHNLTNIECMGFISKAQLGPLIKNSKAVLVPSEWYENCSISVLEAKAKSKPVIASNIGGISEQVTDGKNGFLFDPGNVESLTSAIRKLEGYPDYHDLCKNSFNDYLLRYSEPVHRESIMKVYGEVINDRSDR